MSQADEMLQTVIAETARRASAGADIDSMLRFLRESGVDMADSMWALVQAGVARPGDAKKIVYASDLWRADRGSHEMLQDAVAEAVRELWEDELDSPDGSRSGS